MGSSTNEVREPLKLTFQNGEQAQDTILRRIVLAVLSEMGVTGVSQEEIENAVSSYMSNHPIDTLTESEVTEIVADYISNHPTGVDASEVNALIADYMSNHPIHDGEKGDTGATPNITATASVDSTSGTPSVNVSKSGTAENPNFSFAFSGIKGNKGDKGNTGATPNITVNASVDNTTSTPNVEVAKSGTNENPIFSFGFSGLKGNKGDKGNTGTTPNITVSASVDNTSGTPTVNVTKGGTTENPSFAFGFSGLKGAKGDRGDSGIEDEVTITDTSLTSITLNPNTFYILPTLSALDVAFDISKELSGKANSYHFAFLNGETPCELTLPNSVTYYPADMEIKANTYVEINVLNGAIAWQSWEIGE